MRRLVRTTWMLVFFMAWNSGLFAQQLVERAVLPPSLTDPKPIVKPWKGMFTPDEGITFSNDFPAGRLSGVAKINDSTYNCLITAENTPINASPWYAFKVNSEKAQRVTILLTYPDGVRHRYTPKISYDGSNWISVDTLQIHKVDSSRSFFEFSLDLEPGTIWVAGQEITTVADVNRWTDTVASRTGAMRAVAGESISGRDIPVFKFGNPDSKKVVIVMGRQHPPEISGHLGMKGFVDGISADNEKAKAFRSEYLIYFFPMVNPDGVEEGHWRHNMAGVDLNRDWFYFNQPETRAVRDYLDAHISADDKVYFAIDFHTTFRDVYYVIQSHLPRNTDRLLERWISGIESRVPGYEANVSPSYSGFPVVFSYNYFYEKYGAESLIYEVGDEVPRDYILQKADAAARSLMEILMQETAQSSDLAPVQ